MNLGQKLTEKLNAIRLTANVKESGKDSGYVIEQEIDSIRLRLEMQDFDKFSCMVKILSLTRLQPLPVNKPMKETLLRQAHEIGQRISYLLENFRLIELDETKGIAQIRSVVPHRKGDEKFYYEVLLQQGNSVTFTRYRKFRQAEQRDLVPSHLTQETFERLVDDLAAVVRLG
jgi:hypothetical protein